MFFRSECGESAPEEKDGTARGVEEGEDAEDEEDEGQFWFGVKRVKESRGVVNNEEYGRDADEGGNNLDIDPVDAADTSDDLVG